MSKLLFTLLLISIIGSLTLLLIKARSSLHRKTAITIFSGLVLFAIVLSFGPLKLPDEDITLKGAESEEISVVIVMYLSMALGMLGNYLFNHFIKPEKKRTKLDFGVLIAPVFVSPFVFLPLFSTFFMGGFETTSSRIMLYLVAFENGFFWKEFFDNRLKSHKKKG